MEKQKNLKISRSGPKGGQVSLSQPNWILSNSFITNARSVKILLWMLLVDVIIFGTGHFFPRVLFFGKILWKMLIFHVFQAQIFLWSRNQFLIVISASEWSNCPLSDAENRRAVACSGTEWHSHLWAYFWFLPNFGPPSGKINELPRPVL